MRLQGSKDTHTQKAKWAQAHGDIERRSASKRLPAPTPNRHRDPSYSLSAQTPFHHQQQPIQFEVDCCRQLYELFDRLEICDRKDGYVRLRGSALPEAGIGPRSTTIRKAATCCSELHSLQQQRPPIAVTFWDYYALIQLQQVAWIWFSELHGLLCAKHDTTFSYFLSNVTS
jgi:hypothetical protein